MPEELGQTIPLFPVKDAVGVHDGEFSTRVAHVKLFNQYNGYRFYVTNWVPETGQCLGLVTHGSELRIATWDLDALANQTVMPGLMAVERDLYWDPKPIADVVKCETWGWEPEANSQAAAGDTELQNRPPDFVYTEDEALAETQVSECCGGTYRQCIASGCQCSCHR